MEITYRCDVRGCDGSSGDAKRWHTVTTNEPFALFYVCPRHAVVGVLNLPPPQQPQELTKREACPDCKGTGEREPETRGDTTVTGDCSSCYGTGRRRA